LKTLSENLQAAWSQDRLDEFFDAAAHNTSPFEKHSLALVQIIADSAVRLQFSSPSPLFDFDSLLRLRRFSNLFAKPG
jgi:hypothetical protein